MNHCRCCPRTGVHAGNPHFSQHQDPATAYNQAWYHYQSYLYYWSIYKAQFSQSQSLCECYEDRTNTIGLPEVYTCTDCPDGQGTCRSAVHPYPREYNLYNEASDNMEVQIDDDDEVHHDENDCDDFEVDEGFYTFLKQSEKHREERERAKRAMAKDEEYQYIEVGKRQINASTLPPEEHEEAKRKKAMDTLYGNKASFIMSLEASLQLHYNRNFDTRQPIFWPNIPLKF